MKFVLFHGAFGSPEGNWFPQLKEKLEAMGQVVIVPQFPVDSWDGVTKAGKGILPKYQSLQNWLKTFETAVLPKIKQRERLCFIGHSLGPLFILHIVERFNLQLDSAIFTCPFLDKLQNAWQIDHVNLSFWKTDFDFAKLRQLIPISYVIYSNNDPYVEEKYSLQFAERMKSSLIPARGIGHMNSEVPLLSFPLVYELCKTRLDKAVWT